MISLYLLGILIGIVAALIMNWSTFRGKPVPFVMELPNYRLPSLKSVALLLWEKAKDFLQRAFTVIFLATIIIWFLQSFDIRLNVVADSADSLLALIGRWIAPVFAPLGFADWRCATSLISGFIAKESVVSTLEVLLGGPAFYNVHQPLRRELPGLYAAVYSVYRGGSHDPAGIRLNAENGRRRADAVLCRMDRGIRRLRLDRYLMMGIDWILFFYSLKPLPSPISHTYIAAPRHINQ